MRKISRFVVVVFIFVTLFSSLTSTITKASDVLFTGTVSSPTWGGNAGAPVFDGSISSVYYGDAGDIVVMDLGAGNEKKLTVVRYYPVEGPGYYQGRVESNIQGSNDGINYTQILHIPSAEGTGVQWCYRQTLFPTYWQTKFPTFSLNY